MQSGFGLRFFSSTGFIKGDDASMDPQNFRTSITTFGCGVVFIELSDGKQLTKMNKLLMPAIINDVHL